MALNYSHPTIFPARLPDDNLVSPFIIGNSCLAEGVPERRGDTFVRPREMHDFFDCGEDGSGAVNSQELVPNDILNLLPADPFGMDMSSTFTAAIAGPLEDMEVDFGFGSAEVGTSIGNYPLFVGWNLIWNNAFGFASYTGNSKLVDKKPSEMGISSCHGMSGNICKTEDALSNNGSTSCSETIEGAYADCSGNSKLDDRMQVPRDVLCHGASDIVCNMDDDASSSNGNDRYSHTNAGICADVYSGTPHNAFIFSLGHLGVCDLITVERVCKSLRCTVRNDPLLWRTIHIDQRLSERITDDILLQLTDRAQGKLQSLSLMECTKITDDVLKCVLERNLSLTKLSVPGCTRLSIDGVLSCLKAFNSAAIPGITHLRIGGLYGMTESHFEDFKALLAMNDEMPASVRKPHFYSREKKYLSADDDRAIDIEVCPMCLNFRLLYDCPAREHTAQICRACIICIPRCVDCGRCINDGEFEETFCLELLCFVCGEQSMDCEVKREIKASSPTYFNYQEASFPFQG